MMSEPTSQELCGRGARCLRGLRTYLPGTVGQRCRLFKRCQNLFPGHCGEGVQAIEAMSDSSSQALWGRCAGCLSDVGTYLPGTVGPGAGCLSSVVNYLLGCRLFMQCQNLPPGTVGQWCRLFKQCWNLPPSHCLAVVQAVKVESEPTSWAL